MNSLFDDLIEVDPDLARRAEEFFEDRATAIVILYGSMSRCSGKSLMLKALEDGLDPIEYIKTIPFLLDASKNKFLKD